MAYFILGVSLTHLVESRYQFFLDAEIIDNIFQWDVLKLVADKSYGDIFQTMRAFNVCKILNTKILSKKFLQNESCFLIFFQIC